LLLLLLLLLLLQEYLLCGFDFVLAPLVQPGHEQPALQLPQDGSAVEPRIREELMLTSASWGGQVGVRGPPKP
jgi:protein arginine N-methyltransferase 5